MPLKAEHVQQKLDHVVTQILTRPIPLPYRDIQIGLTISRFPTRTGAGVRLFQLVGVRTAGEKPKPEKPPATE